MTGAASVIPRAADECVMRTAPDRGQVAPQAERWVLAATILGSSIASIDGTVVNVALPVMQRSFHATSSDLQWVIEAYSLFLSALILVGGSLGDRLGRRRVYAAGIMIFAVASVACGLAPTIGVLIAARCIQGIGGALLVPGSLSIISASFDPARRGRAIGTWAGFSTLATALGPVVGGWLVQNASWRWVFFLNVPLAAITLVLLYRHVPESRDEDLTGGIDWLGAALITGSLGGLTYGLIEAGPRGFGDPVVVASLVAGVVLLVAFVLAEARSPAPMMPLDIWRSRTFTGTNLLTLLLYGALGGSLYFLPFNLQQVQGYSPTAAGAAFLPFIAIVFVLSRWTGGLVQRYGAKRPLIIGPIISAIGFVLFAVPDIGGSFWITFFPAIVVLSLGMSLVIAPLTTAVMNALETHRSGVASGVNNAVSRVAGLLAIAVLGLVVAGVFNTHLDSSLSSLPVPASAKSAVESQRTKLVGASLPSGLSASQRAQLERVLKESFVAGFRAAMLVSAGLALASSIFAAWLIDGRKPEPTAAVQTEKVAQKA
ncbi:MAG TPA: MFS transporter [Chloroflexota bacterium]